MTQPNKYLRRGRPIGFAPSEFAPERIERTEHEEARRSIRDWLRERDEETTLDFADSPEDEACPNTK